MRECVCVCINVCMRLIPTISCWASSPLRYSPRSQHHRSPRHRWLFGSRAVVLRRKQNGRSFGVIRRFHGNWKMHLLRQLVHWNPDGLLCQQCQWFIVTGLLLTFYSQAIFWPRYPASLYTLILGHFFIISSRLSLYCAIHRRAVGFFHFFTLNLSIH